MFICQFRSFRKCFLLLVFPLFLFNLAEAQRASISVSYHPPLFSANKETWKNIQMQSVAFSLGYDGSFIKGEVGLEYYTLAHTVSSQSSEHVLIGVTFAIRPLVSLYTRYQPIIGIDLYGDMKKEETNRSLPVPKKNGGFIGLEIYLTDHLCLIPKLHFHQLVYDIPSKKEGATYSYFNSAISLQYTL